MEFSTPPRQSRAAGLALEKVIALQQTAPHHPQVAIVGEGAQIG
jgi:hypothetical protein